MQHAIWFISGIFFFIATATIPISLLWFIWSEDSTYLPVRILFTSMTIAITMLIIGLISH